MTPDPPPPSGPPGLPEPPSLTGPPPPVSSVVGALGQFGSGMAGRAAGALLPYLAACARNPVVFALVVDGGSAATSTLFDDLQRYVQTHNVDLGPFDFIKSDF